MTNDTDHEPEDDLIQEHLAGLEVSASKATVEILQMINKLRNI